MNPWATIKDAMTNNTPYSLMNLSSGGTDHESKAMVTLLFKKHQGFATSR